MASQACITAGHAAGELEARDHRVARARGARVFLDEHEAVAAAQLRAELDRDRREAFVLVKRKDREPHIYGTGKDHRVIVARYGAAEDGAAGKDAGTTTGTPATGGTGAA